MAKRDKAFGVLFWNWDKAVNLIELNFSFLGNQEDVTRRFEDCPTSIQQIIHCIETVEAQLREKRQTIEEISARYEALAGELALAVGDLGCVLSDPLC